MMSALWRCAFSSIGGFVQESTATEHSSLTIAPPTGMVLARTVLVQPRPKSSGIWTGAVTKIYGGCITALYVIVPAWVPNLWNATVPVLEHSSAIYHCPALRLLASKSRVTTTRPAHSGDHQADLIETNTGTSYHTQDRLKLTAGDNIR